MIVTCETNRCKLWSCRTHVHPQKAPPHIEPYKMYKVIKGLSMTLNGCTCKPIGYNLGKEEKQRSKTKKQRKGKVQKNSRVGTKTLAIK